MPHMWQTQGSYIQRKIKFIFSWYLCNKSDCSTLISLAAHCSPVLQNSHLLETITNQPVTQCYCCSVVQLTTVEDVFLETDSCEIISTLPCKIRYTPPLPGTEAHIGYTVSTGFSAVILTSNCILAWVLHECIIYHCLIYAQHSYMSIPV